MDILPHERQIEDYKKMILQVKEQGKLQDAFWTQSEIRKLEEKLNKLKEKVYSKLTPWERVTICRHPSRPHTVDYIKHICDEFTELFGDRTFRDDKAVIGGLCRIQGEKFMLIGQEKGHDTESRLKRNFGMPHPEGYRKALRLMKLAEKFQLPVLSLLDTPGAYPGLTAEERGQGLAIAQNLMSMAKISTPIIVVIIGEGCSGGALGMGVGDVIGMLEHSYYSVISPEGCASILWKESNKKDEAAHTLKLNAEDLKGLDIIDTIIKEPMGGAHHEPLEAYKNVKNFILEEWHQLKTVSKDLLLEMRYCKFRKMGKFIAL